MGLKSFDLFSWAVGFLVILVYSLLPYVGCRPLCGYWGFVLSEMFCLDVVGLYLVVLSALLCLFLFPFVSGLSVLSTVMLLVSIVSSILCYCCVHSFWFWCFYEVSILSLLLLVIAESPYPERYMASWYLIGYVVLSSLPMLLSFLYLSIKFGSCKFYCWSLEGMDGEFCFEVLLLLSVLFITKIPLFPFHVWLPLVHAEASSPVSICLSGYVMKLGLLGLCRVCSWLLPGDVFGELFLVVCLVASVLFFISAVNELDGKRWLAFMSLSHIVIPCICFGIFQGDEVGSSLLYGLGHGLSAGMMFMLLWISYEMVGSRNWFVLKSVVFGGVIFVCLLVSSFCVVMSIPPTVQFFCEIFAISKSSGFSYVLFFFLGVYLFIGGLVPLVLLGGLMIGHVELRCCVGSIFGKVVPLVYLCIWCLLLFAVLS